MCVADAEGPSCSTVTRPVARERHQCCECRGVIEPGTRYVRTTGVWDHRPAAYAQHIECVAMVKEIADRWCDGQWVFGGLAEMVDEHEGDDPGLRGRYDALPGREVAHA